MIINFPLNYKITFKEKYGNPECDKKHKKKSLHCCNDFIILTLIF